MVWGTLVVKHSSMFMIHPHQPGEKTSLNPLHLLLTFLDSRRVHPKLIALLLRSREHWLILGLYFEINSVPSNFRQEMDGLQGKFLIDVLKILLLLCSLELRKYMELPFSNVYPLFGSSFILCSNFTLKQRAWL